MKELSKVLGQNISARCTKLFAWNNILSSPNTTKACIHMGMGPSINHIWKSRQLKNWVMAIIYLISLPSWKKTIVISELEKEIQNSAPIFYLFNSDDRWNIRLQLGATKETYWWSTRQVKLASIMDLKSSSVSVFLEYPNIPTFCNIKFRSCDMTIGHMEKLTKRR